MKKIVLCIMDGVGLSNEKKGNAFLNANTPYLDKLIKMYPHSKIEASGSFVGLPEGQMGNSEVGHLNIGAGRILYQPLAKINKSINDKTFFENESILNCINHVKKEKSSMHIIGMLSDGGVHSHINHIESIFKMCVENGIKNIYFHVITDGRDTYYKNSKKYLDELQNLIDKYNEGSISSLCGRYYAMDRDKRWDRVKKAYDLIFNGNGVKFDNYSKAISDSYNKGIYDEFIEPIIIDENGLINSNDGIIWANFRPDRSRELLETLCNDKFDKFDLKKVKNLYLTTMMWVSDDIKSDIAFKEDIIDNTLGVCISKNNLKQLRVAETEKYAHVTYFFDGLQDLSLKKCKKIMVPSAKISTYDLEPEMKAKEITDVLIDELDKDYDFILVNYANGDMVGHTGNYSASIKAIETLDSQIGRLYNKCIKDDYLLIITADHGNCESMIDSNNKVMTKHTSNKVPFIVCDKNITFAVEKLSDIAPFILNLMNLKIPDEMK